jgi:hypothetical protein
MSNIAGLACRVVASSQQLRAYPPQKSTVLKLPSAGRWPTPKSTPCGSQLIQGGTDLRPLLAGNSVNFVDVLPHKSTAEHASGEHNRVTAPCLREEHLTKRRAAAVHRLCDQLQVAKRVAVALTAQEPHLAGYGTGELTTAMAMFAEYFGMSLPTLGKTLTLRPDFVASPQLLQSHITHMSSLLSINPLDLPSLISRAPELIAYSPQYFASELQSLATLLRVEAYEAAALVRVEPRILVIGIKKLTDRLERLSIALNKPSPAILAIAKTCPAALFLNTRMLRKKREFIDEVCLRHPAWQQQLANMPVLVLVEVLKAYGAPTFMRLRFLAEQGHQPSTDLVRVFAASTRQFDKQWPQWALWVEENTPSYLFE